MASINTTPKTVLPFAVSRHGRRRRQAQVKIHNALESVTTKNDAAKEYDQRKEEAGIFVTAELNAAIERCRRKVERIAKECRRRNRRFRDIEFDLEGDQYRCLWGLDGPEDGAESPKGVRRASSMFNEPVFFVKPDHPGKSPIQGRLGNCWFLSAIATVSTIPRLIEQICVARDEKVGIYGFIFYMDGGWVDVAIDDFLCTSASRYDELSVSERALYQYDQEAYNSRGRQGSKALFFSSSGEDNETWVPLLEKAYAKVYGDYAALEGGFSEEALEDLTGGVASSISVADILDPDEFWSEQLMKVGEDRLFGCYIMGVDPSEYSEQTTLVNGLILCHAYSVISAMEVAGKKFVKLRNPWGRSEWTGPFSDGSKEWTPEWLQRMPELKHSFGDDGEFLMEYSDFLKTWTEIAHTQLFDPSWLLSSQWLTVTSRSYPCAWNFGDVSFTISVPKATPAVIVLGKINSRGWRELGGMYRWTLDYTIFPRGALEPLCTATPVGVSRRTLSIEVDLEPGEYVVQVRLDRYLDKTAEEMDEATKSWDPRKLSRKAADKEISESIAINFDPELSGNALPLPASYFAGKDLTEVEMAQNASSAPKLPVDLSITTSDEPASISVTSKPLNNGDHGGEDDKRPSDDGTVGKTPGEESKAPMAGGGNGEKSIYVDYRCNNCWTTPIVGVRYRCLDSTCLEVDLCQKCFEEDSHPKQHALLRLKINTDCQVVGSRPPSPSPSSASSNDSSDSPIHTGFSCNICKDSPIVGARYHCLAPDCSDFDMCQQCMDGGSHPKSHQVMRIYAPADDHSLEDDGDKIHDQITLGLRVYTKKHAPATVRGQLRHGKVLKWKRSES